MALLVDRDVGEIAIGNEDRLCLLPPDHPGFEMHGDRRTTHAHQTAVHGYEVADIDGLAKIHRVDRYRDVARLGDLGREYAAADIHLAEQPAAENVTVLIGV